MIRVNDHDLQLQKIYANFRRTCKSKGVFREFIELQLNKLALETSQYPLWIATGLSGLRLE